MRHLSAVLATCFLLTPTGRAATIDFAQQIYPILTRSCIKCHGEKKQSGELALHLPSSIEEFGVVIPGEPEESSLFERITLDKDDELRMPKGSSPLTDNDVALIRKWIEEGATMPPDEAVQQATQEALNLPDAEAAAEQQLANVRDAGALVIALYADSPLLQVSFAYAAEPATDEQLQPLAGIAQQIVALNLARSAVTDDGLAAIEPLENLMRLHLENTAITDVGLKHLSNLTRLEYLNLYGTRVTDAGLAHLSPLTNLKKLYLWQTDATYAAAMELQQRLPGLEVNLGWDHPEVVKAREARKAELARQREAELAAADQPKDPESNAKVEAKVEQKVQADETGRAAREPEPPGA